MDHQLVQLVHRWTTITRAAPARDAQPLCNDERVLHRLLVKLISPCWPGDREHCRKMREIIAHGLRRDLRYELIREYNDVGTRNGRTRPVRDIIAFDRTSYLSLRSTNVF